MQPTYRLELAYHGAAFAGFCRQPSQVTVEGLLRDALSELAPQWTAMAFAGATDRGVHALAQVVSFRAQPGLEAASLQAALLAHGPRPALPPTGFAELDHALGQSPAVVRALHAVPRRFHASFAARSRRYRYRLRHHAEVERLDPMLRALEGERDVRALARQPRRGGSTVKTIIAARAHRDGDHICFDVTASGFLRRQMRVLVATALREAEAGAATMRLVELCALGDPRRTAPPAPPHGLCLWAVDYAPASETATPSLAASTSLKEDQSSASSDAVSQRPSR